MTRTTVAPRIIALSLLISGAVHASSQEAALDPNIIARVMTLYGLSEDAAVERLAAEVDAAELHEEIERQAIDGYAGSWFDGESLTLKVATNRPESIESIRAMGASPVRVSRSLQQLERLQERVGKERGLNTALANLYIDVRNNRLVVGVRRGSAEAVRNIPSLQDSAIALLETDAQPVPSLGAVIGATGTQNLSWLANSPPPEGQDGWPCSIGAAVNGGYVTAGHCGQVGHQMGTTAQEPLGVVQLSNWPWGQNSGGDSGFVQTSTGWTPTPAVQGYNDGVFSVPAKWSGMSVAPIGTTVCRYGRTSGGPHCGTVGSMNTTVNFGAATSPFLINGLTVLDGACSSPGDSGGTHVAAGSGQIQGTNTGVQGPNEDVSSGFCPNVAAHVFLIPIRTTLELANRRLLTTHGSNPATIVGFSCEGLTRGNIFCKMDYYNSQGNTSIQWTASTGASSTGTFLRSTCTPGQSVTVSLKVVNPYGTTTKGASVTCPSFNY